MGRTDYKTCKRCSKHANEVGILSHTRLCASCAEAVLHENIEGLATHSGPRFRAWREGMAAAVGATLLDARRSSP
jgi:hypothetical protein